MNIDQIWGYVVLAGGGIATMATIISNLDKMIPPLARVLRARKERREAPLKALEMIGTLSAQMDALQGEVTEIKRENREQSAKLDNLDKDMADSLCNQLMREHDVYVTRGWCSAADKARVQDVHTRYRDRKRNHLADHYMQDITCLPEHPPAQAGTIQ